MNGPKKKSSFADLAVRIADPADLQIKQIKKAPRSGGAVVFLVAGWRSNSGWIPMFIGLAVYESPHIKPGGGVFFPRLGGMIIYAWPHYSDQIPLSQDCYDVGGKLGAVCRWFELHNV